MKKIITLFPLRAVIMLLAVLPSMLWAYDVGPWTFEGCRTGNCDWGTQSHQSYNGLNNTHWDVYQWNSAENGVNFIVQGDSQAKHRLAIFAHFSCTPLVPAYTCMHLKWTGTLKISEKELTGSVTLYKGNNKDELLKRQVDFSEKLWAGEDYHHGRITYLIQGPNYDYSNQKEIIETTDVTETFLRGAEETAALARLCGAERALLKERSPSCGIRERYDGSFSGKTIPGMGKTAERLLQEGVRLFSEEETERL